MNLFSYFKKRRLDAQMDAEMRSHIEMQTQENIDSGMSPEAARYAALRQFGHSDSIKETCRDQRGINWMDSLIQDVKFAIRMLGKTPGFTAVAVITLALSIGVSTAVYSIINTLLLNPIPGPEPERIMQIAELSSNPGGSQFRFYGVSTLTLDALRSNQQIFSEMAWWDGIRLEKKTESGIVGFGGFMVPPQFFKFWNIPPLLGRTFNQDEVTYLRDDFRPAGGTAIILSHSLWQSLCGGDPSIVGKSIALRGEGAKFNEPGHHYTVIGVMPPHFQFPRGSRPTFWIPAEDHGSRQRTSLLSNTGLLVRLKPGINQEQAQSMLDVTASHLIERTLQDKSVADWAMVYKNLKLLIRPLHQQFTHGSGHGGDLASRTNFKQTLFGLFGAIGFVLLIACVNIANLTLARTERRQQELNVRAALGAGRLRLIRQLFTESLFLAFLGAIGGVAVTAWAMKLLVVLIPPNMPRLRPIEIDTSVLGSCLLVSFATVLIFGIAPAWRGGRFAVGDSLKQNSASSTISPGWRRYRAALVVTEVALSLVLLAGAGLMIQSVSRLLRVNPGFDPEHLVFINIYTHDEAETRAVLYHELQERLSSVPGVKALGIVRSVPRQKFKVEGRNDEVLLDRGYCGIESLDYFRAMRIPLLAGRFLERRDVEQDVMAVVINESMAKYCWPEESALGRRFRWPNHRGDQIFEVVGVVGDARTFAYDQKVGPTFYRPYHDEVRQGLHFSGSAPCLVLRSASESSEFVMTVRKLVAEVVPHMGQDIGESPIQVVRQILYNSTEAQRTYMVYLVIFAGVGLFLSALGIYGVLAYSVTRRTREIGIRMAIGAQQHHVLKMILSEGARLVCSGVIFGLLGAFWLTRLIQNQLFGVSPSDPITMATAVLVMVLISLLACLLPAHRAARIDPMQALRHE